MKKRILFYSMGAVVLTGLIAFGTWHCLKYAVVCQMGNVNSTKIENWPDLLKLDASQRQKAAPMLAQFKSDMNQLQMQLADSQISFCKLMMQSSSTEQKDAKNVIDQLNQLRKQKDEMTFGHLMAMKKILTPEQEKILYTTIMQDICVECRAATGMNKEHCGMCDMKGQAK